MIENDQRWSNLIEILILQLLRWWKIHAGAVFNIPGASKQPKWVVFHEIHKTNVKQIKNVRNHKKRPKRACGTMIHEPQTNIYIYI